MTNVKIKKDKLVEILTKNRSEHREIFLEAQKIFREQVIKKLDSMLESARNNKKIDLYLGLNPPQDNTDAYDTVLYMLNLSEDDIITLTHEEFKNYVQDEWDWSRSFAVSNALYVNGNVGIGTTTPASQLLVSKYGKHLNNK